MMGVPRVHAVPLRATPQSLLKPKYLKTVKTPTGRSSRLSPHPPAPRLSVSLNRSSPKTVRRPATPLARVLGDTSQLGKHRITLLWTKKRAELLSPLSAGYEVDCQLGLEGIKIRHSVTKPAPFRVARLRPKPLELALPSISLKTEEDR